MNSSPESPVPLTSISMNMPASGAIARNSGMSRIPEAKRSWRAAQNPRIRSSASGASVRCERRLLDETRQPEQHAHRQLFGMDCQFRALPAIPRASRHGV